mgnify:CR=1 FL=1
MSYANLQATWADLLIDALVASGVRRAVVSPGSNGSAESGYPAKCCLIANFTCIFFLHFLFLLYIQPDGFSQKQKEDSVTADKRYVKI